MHEDWIIIYLLFRHTCFRFAMTLLRDICFLPNGCLLELLFPCKRGSRKEDFESATVCGSQKLWMWITYTFGFIRLVRRRRTDGIELNNYIEEICFMNSENVMPRCCQDLGLYKDIRFLLQRVVTKRYSELEEDLDSESDCSSTLITTSDDSSTLILTPRPRKTRSLSRTPELRLLTWRRRVRLMLRFIYL